jgi:ribosomal protein S18 acetylase RimI-like enzyme
METRAATPEDAPLVAAHRRAMFAEMQAGDAAALATLEAASIPWTASKIREGRYLGWITESDRQAVASAGLLILDMPPHPLDPEGVHRAHLLNVFVEPGHRHRGLARELIELCLREAERRSIRVVTLNASEAGRPLYEKLGFRVSNEMMRVAR